MVNAADRWVLPPQTGATLEIEGQAVAVDRFFLKNGATQPEYPGPSMYAELEERNEWEGETWYFFIPMKGNRRALEDLEDALRQIRGDCAFSLRLDAFKEEAVETMDAHGGSTSYLAEFNMLVGKLEGLPLRDEDQLLGALYKGGIRDYVN